MICILLLIIIYYYYSMLTRILDNILLFAWCANESILLSSHREKVTGGVRISSRIRKGMWHLVSWLTSLNLAVARVL